MGENKNQNGLRMMSSKAYDYSSIPAFLQSLGDSNLNDKNIGSAITLMYDEVRKQAIRHCTRSEMKELNEIARPNEEKPYKDWREANKRKITVAPIMFFRRMLIRIIQSSFNLQKIKELGFTDIYDAVEKIIFRAIYDTNSIIVEWPFRKDDIGNEMVTLADPAPENANLPIELRFDLVSSQRIKFFRPEDKFTIYHSGSYADYGTEKKKAPIYIGIDSEAYYKLYPKEKTKENGQKVLYYEPIPYYTHAIEGFPVISLFGLEAIDENENNYLESICWQAFEFLDEAAVSFSSDQVGHIRMMLPKLVVDADVACPTCNGAKVEKTKDKDNKLVSIPCRTCNGQGNLSVLGDFTTIKLRQVQSDNKKTNQGLYYLQPPSGLEYSMKRWQTFMDLAEKSLCTDPVEGSGNESGISKQYRLEPKQDLLRVVGEGLASTITRWVNTRLKLSGKKDEFSITAPSYYETRSPEMLKDAVYSSLFGQRGSAYLKYVNSEYRGDAFAIKIHEIAIVYAPLLLYDKEEVAEALATTAYNKNDIVRRDFAIHALTRVLADKKEPFDLTQIFEECDTYLRALGKLKEAVEIIQ